MADPVKATALIHQPKYLWYDGYEVDSIPFFLSKNFVRRSYTVLNEADFVNTKMFPDRDAVEAFFRRTGTVVELTVCPSCREKYDAEVQSHDCEYSEEKDSWGYTDYAVRPDNSESSEGSSSADDLESG